jgi:putative (di)nucleoside polyphosphate hydrolase
MARFESLPYRPCAGLTVLNRKGLAFIGRRIDGPEHVDNTHVWQMPQGGIDAGEDPWPAALRELREETNIRSVEKLGEIEEWLTYDIPRDIGQAWGGENTRLTQKCTLRSVGVQSQIDIASRRQPRPGVRGMAMEPLEDLPDDRAFKRPVYERWCGVQLFRAAPG